MGAGKPTLSGWQQVPVLLRSDIVAAAEREHLDMSDECNRALAIRLQINFERVVETPQHEPSQVIIAPAGLLAKTLVRSPAAVPVINAEDPLMPGKVLREKREKKGQKAPLPAKKETAPQKPVPSRHDIPEPQPSLLTGEAKTRRKGKKEDAIKQFISRLIVRETEESPEGIIAKDELYLRFERFCRDHNYSAIPDRRTFTVTLKNKYAFIERMVGSVPSWTGIRIK